VNTRPRGLLAGAMAKHNLNSKWLLLALMPLAAVCGCCCQAVPLPGENQCPTDARRLYLTCGEEAVRRCPCGPDREFYGLKPTSWRMWPEGWRESASFPHDSGCADPCTKSNCPHCDYSNPFRSGAWPIDEPTQPVVEEELPAYAQGNNSPVAEPVRTESSPVSTSASKVAPAETPALSPAPLNLASPDSTQIETAPSVTAPVSVAPADTHSDTLPFKNPTPPRVVNPTPKKPAAPQSPPAKKAPIIPPQTPAARSPAAPPRPTENTPIQVASNVQPAVEDKTRAPVPQPVAQATDRSSLPTAQPVAHTEVKPQALTAAKIESANSIHKDAGLSQRVATHLLDNLQGTQSERPVAHTEVKQAAPKTDKAQAPKPKHEDPALSERVETHLNNNLQL
jgi:hypothetical protein